MAGAAVSGRHTVPGRCQKIPGESGLGTLCGVTRAAHPETQPGRLAARFAERRTMNEHSQAGRSVPVRRAQNQPRAVTRTIEGTATRERDRRWGGLSLRTSAKVATGLLISAQLVGCSRSDLFLSDQVPDPAPASVSPSESSSPAVTGPGTTELSFRSTDHVPGPADCLNRQATMTGTAGNDRFTGTPGRDVIAARGGDDVVVDISEKDLVCAGGGDDIVRSSLPGYSYGVALGAGDDRLRFLEAADIRGGPGDDRIVVDRGSGMLSGGPGEDYLRSMTTKQPYGYPENAPCADFASGRAVRVDLAAGRASGQGQDKLVNFRCAHGSGFDDVIIGTAKRDGVTAGWGFDLLLMGAGNDYADGGPEADRIYLGPGRDYGNGMSGWDRLYGGAGSDSLEGWTHGDYLNGGTGNDQLYAALFCAIGGNSYDTAGLMDDSGNELFGGPGSDYLVGDRGNDRLDGGSGYDQGQGGYRDGHIDWMDSLERTIDGCLPYVELGKAFLPRR
jgi:Ca2+-binding RTX toxin-like protein